jgi:hypothetical protein
MAGLALYEINAMLQEAIAAAVERIDQDTGIIPEDWSEFLDAVEMERDKKALDLARWIKSIEAEADAVKLEKLKLAHRQCVLEKQAESIRDYLRTAVKEGEKLKDANTQIGWRKSTRAIIDNVNAIPDLYCAIERKVNVANVKKVLMDGEKVPGAHIEQFQNIQIR